MIETHALIRPAKLAHLVLRTARFAEVVDWWSTVLHLEVRHGSPVISFLTYDDEHHRLAIINNPNLEDNDKSRAGFEHIAFTYESLDDLLATYVRLKEAGITPIAPINHGMTMSLYYADPDGNQCELQVDTMTVAEAEAFMASPVFEANPIGVRYDPDEIVARRAAGESVESVTEYIPA